MRKLQSIIIMLIMCLSATIAQSDIIQVGQKTPDFTYKTEDGKLHRLSDMKGKVVLINFFATWCGPCRSELPLLQQKIWDKYGSSNEFCLLVIGRQHTSDEVKAFKSKYGFNMPMIADPERSIFNLFAKESIPRNYIIDGNGTVIYTSIGYSEEQFMNLVDVLSKKVTSKTTESKFKFDKKFYQCENRWVFIPSKQNINEYMCGFVYLDEMAGFTFNVEGVFKQDEEKHKFDFKPQSKMKIIKVRLSNNSALFGILPDSLIKQFGLETKPEWLKTYHIDDPDKHDVIVGEKLNGLGACKDALPILEKVYVTKPHTKGLEFELVFALNALKKHERAIVVLNDAIKNNPNEILFYRELGYAYMCKGDSQNAIKIYTESIAKCNDNQKDVKREMALNLAAVYKLNLKNDSLYNYWKGKSNEWETKKNQQ